MKCYWGKERKKREKERREKKEKADISSTYKKKLFHGKKNKQLS